MSLRKKIAESQLEAARLRESAAETLRELGDAVDAVLYWHMVIDFQRIEAHHLGVTR